MSGESGPLFGITLSGLRMDGKGSFGSATAAALRLQAETGFNAVEIWMDGVENHPTCFWPEDYDDALSGKMADFLSHFDCCGVHLPFAYSDYTCVNPAVREAARRQILLAIDVSGRLGARYVVGHARFHNLNRVCEDENFRLYAEAMRRFATRAADLGMRYCVETCEFLDTPEKMVRMVRQVDHPNCYLTLDAGKMMVYASEKFRNPEAADWSDGSPNMLAWLDEYAGLIGSTHLWDYEQAPGRGGRILPGNGLCDVKRVVEKLVASGYPGSYNLETSGTYEQEKAAVITLKGYLDEAAAEAD